MAKVTFCPHHILAITEETSPEVIEKFFIRPLVDFLKSAFDNELSVCVSQKIMTEFENTHPWRLMRDPHWEKWISDWYSILKPLLSKAEILKHSVSEEEGTNRCDGLSTHINNIFNNFLDVIATHTLPDDFNEEAIYTPTPWCANYNDFITINSIEQIKFAKYTWYKIYPSTLPCQGEFPFVPPVIWKRSTVPNRGNAPGYGYMDSNRREWIWDTLHDNHWDVQNPGGGRGNYTNVSPEGRVLGND